jgi:signal transduction histidine kinase/GAF domain-containing protein
VTTKDDKDERLRSAALQTANSILIARQRAEQRREAYLAEAQRLSHTGSFGWRPSASEIHWSEETFRIFQYDPTTTPTVDLVLRRVHPEDVALVKQTFERASQDGKDFALEHRLLMPDGSVTHVHVVAHASSDASGRIEFVGAVMDVTEQRQARAALEKAFDQLAGEKRLLEMVARGESLTLILDALCRLVEELASGSRSSILLLEPNGNRLRHGAAPSLPATYSEAIDGLVIGPTVGSCGTAAYRAEPVVVSDIATDPLWADFRALALAHGLRACWSAPILSSEGRVLGTFATYYLEPRSPTAHEQSVIEQITHLASIAIERKRAEAELRASAAYLAEAQRLAHTASYALDIVARKIIHWSQEHFRMFDFDPALGPPSFDDALERIHPDDRERVTEVLARAHHERTDYELECRIVLRNGTIKYIHGVGHPVFNASGDHVENVGTIMDVTERKRADEERERLRQAQAELAHVARVTTLGEMAASIAHEVDQPLSGVVINANACLRFLAGVPPNLDEVRDGLQAIARDGRRASDVIARIRALARRTATEKEFLDINEVIRDVVAIAEAEARRTRARLRTELAADLPRVLGDRVQLQQVVLNLLLNGLDAMHAVVGRPREMVISTKREATDRVRVAVQDSGSGIDPQLASRVFEAFYTTKRSGLGMGLSISRTIVEQHGGRLWVVPNDGPGTTFQFTV